ncbi:MAG: nucleotide exchange factor GrpE [Acidobacteria bacterium]|nr:nucleotide exchange factor GrpE [Acidobacteriota bacterium]
MTDEKKIMEDSELSGHAAKGTASEESKNAGSGAQQAELPADLPAAYQQLLAEKQQIYDRLLRKQAEIENVRKRVEREKEDFLQHATMGLIRALLPTLDSLERGLKHREQGVPGKYYEGLELIHRELLEVLKRAGLEPLESEGKVFDPHLHQAVEIVDAEGYRDHEVVEELQRGYKLRHRLLRPAIVKVAISQPKETAAGSEDQPDEDENE